jgi:hypothetical protein
VVTACTSSKATAYVALLLLLAAVLQGGQVSVDAPFTNVDVSGKHKRKLQEDNVAVSVGELVGVSVEVRPGAWGSSSLMPPADTRMACAMHA